MKLPLRRTTAERLKAETAASATAAAKLAELRAERQRLLIETEDNDAIVEIDKQIVATERAIRISQDRLAALDAALKEEHRAQRQREHEAAMAAFTKATVRPRMLAADLEKCIQQLGDLLDRLLESREEVFASWPETLVRPSFETFHQSSLMKEIAWSLYAAGKPTAMSGCRIPSPSNSGLGISGVSPAGIGGCINNEFDAIVSLLKNAAARDLAEQHDEAA
jgi:hypothetical protein